MEPLRGIYEQLAMDLENFDFNSDTEAEQSTADVTEKICDEAMQELKRASSETYDGKSSEEIEEEYISKLAEFWEENNPKWAVLPENLRTLLRNERILPNECFFEVRRKTNVIIFLIFIKCHHF